MSRRARRKEMKGRRKVESLIDMREEDVFEPKNVRDVSHLDRVPQFKEAPAPSQDLYDESVEEEENPYDKLMSSLSDVKVRKHQALFKKRKMEEEGKTEEDVAEEMQKAKKRRLNDSDDSKKSGKKGKDAKKASKKKKQESDSENEGGDGEEGEDEFVDEDWLKEKEALQMKYDKEKEKRAKEMEEGNISEESVDELGGGDEEEGAGEDGESGSDDDDEEEEEKEQDEDADSMDLDEKEGEGEEGEEAAEGNEEEGEEAEEGEEKASNDDEDEEDNILEGVDLLTEAEKEGDPYVIHFETDLTSNQLNPEKGWKELSEIKNVGKVWSDRLTSVPPKKVSLEAYQVKDRLKDPWNAFYRKELSKKSNRKDMDKLQMTDLQETLFPILNDYKDLLFCHRTHKNAKQIQSLYTLHIVNHIIKVRDRVMRNNVKLRAAKESGDLDVELRDQGFTRPRVLVLLPTRNECLDFIQTIFKLAPKIQTDRVANKKKFFQEFYEDTYVPFSRKPDDWLERFKGNMDDSFRLGVNFTARFMRLYSEFYKSDVLVASPLGLRLAIEEHNGDVDFLSSLEMVVLDQAEYHLMQNFDHVNFIFERLNLLPKHYRDTDITRVRMLNLNEQANLYRQTLIFSEVQHGDLNMLFNKFANNAKGRFKIVKNAGDGTVVDVVPHIKQLFQRLDVKSIQEVDDARFKYFTEQVFPHLVSEQAKGVLIFIPSYLDFVRVRNFFRERRKLAETNFTQCCEYTPSGHVTRARSNFFHQKRDVMLFTERFHFFNRYAIRGIQRIVFYAPPQFPHFYPEMLNLVPDVGSSLVLFTKFDAYQLEPIVGTQRLVRLLTSDKSNHMFQ